VGGNIIEAREPYSAGADVCQTQPDGDNEKNKKNEKMKKFRTEKRSFIH
jgi:hypothetical protein